MTKPTTTEETRTDGSQWEVSIYSTGLRTSVRIDRDRPGVRRD